MDEYAAIRNELKRVAHPEYAANLQRFFKTGPGEYGEGDRFIGVRMPQIHMIVSSHQPVSLSTIRRLVAGPIHEYRMCGLLLVVVQYKRADTPGKQKLFDLYVATLVRGYINNWDLIDVTVHKVIGQHLLERDRALLYEFATSPSLWERRAAIISTFAFIQIGEATDALVLAHMLLTDTEDLIHKAVGWVLREVGKSIDERLLCEFLDKYATTMSRTTLRYAIERLPNDVRYEYRSRK